MVDFLPCNITFSGHVWLLWISEANVNMFIECGFCTIKCLYFVVVGINLMPSDIFQSLGCSSVILLRPKMGVALHKHDVISMPTQQCTHTKHISIERYHPVVSIMLRYLDQIKTFGENLCCRKVKIDKIFWGDLPYFALKSDNFPKRLRKKANCPNEAYFLAKKI